MKILPLGVTERYKIEICFINLIILSYLFRTAIPLLKFPFLLLYSCFIVYFLWNFRKRLISKLIEFVRNYYLILLLALILIISFLLSNKLYLSIFKDVVNMIILLSIFFMSTLIVHGKKELNYFVLNMVYLMVLFAFFISVLGLLDFFNVYSYIDYSKDAGVSITASGEPISVDYNFALLPVFFGIISVFYFLLRTDSTSKKIYFNVLLLIYSFDIIFSGSRRGLITLIVILIILVIAQFFVFYSKNTLIRKLGTNSRYFVLSVFLLSILSLLIIFKTDYSFKIKLLELVGSKNIADTKQKIAIKMFKYTLIFGNNRSFYEFYSRIWPSIPEDPDSGWGTRVHKTIFPLTGKNVEIVPNGSKGYLMDSTCNAGYYPSTDICESYTMVVNLNVNKGDRIKASVYCFVSDSFDVNTASFGVGSLCISKNIVSGKVTTLYNLESKGVWQKLEIEFVCIEGDVPIYMSFSKRGVKDFSKLKGYVIFAYPTYEKINKSEDGLSPSVTQSNRDYGKFKNFDFAKKITNKKRNGLFNQLNEGSTESNIYITAFNSRTKPIKISLIGNTSNTQKYISSNIFCLPLSILTASGEIQNDLDPIRNWASKFISEDTTYYPYKSNIVLDTISNAFIGDRVSRWEFALKIFSQEFNWRQKVIGGGFSFLNWYGFYFLKDRTKSDWPHNPFLSVLLYSGIIGLLIYCFFMYKVFYYYFKYRKEYTLFFIFFLTTFFFAFFSAGSPFDPPIMGFFVILPFFIHSIHKKDEPSKEITVLKNE